MAEKKVNPEIALPKEEHPDHIPIIPIDQERELRKQEARKLAEEIRKKNGSVEPIIITSGGVKKASELTYAERELEYVKCATNPIYFIETYLTIFDQTQGEAGEIVRFKLFDYQKDLIQTYIDNRFVVANKYRQAGISTTTCAYIAWYVMFNQNRQVAIVADKLETARDELMSDVVEFINGCPSWLRPKTGRETENQLKDTQKLKLYDNGSRLGAFSSKGLRGMTPTLIFWDETAWTEKGDKFWTSAQPTLQTGGAAIMVSCVTKDTYLYTNKGIKQMQDFIPTEELGAHIIDDYHILGKEKLRQGNLFFNNGYVDTRIIKTRFSELESSLNHKFWAYKLSEKKYGIYKTHELEVGDYVSIQKGKNIWGNNDDCSDFNPTHTSNTKNIFKPSEITPDLAYFIGLYISEGYIHNVVRNGKIHTTQITITCGDDISHIIKKFGFKYYFDGIHYTINSKNIGEFFEYLGFDLSKKAPKKTIPPRLLEMSRENIIAMIQGIMDGDGWSSYNQDKNKLRVGIRLSSKELVNQIRIILGNFGILTEYFESITPPTKKVKVSSQGYGITANNGYAFKYLQEIGFRFDRKQVKINQYKPDDIKHIGVNDNLPNGREILCELFESVKYYGIHKLLVENNLKIKDIIQRKLNQPCSRKTILKFIELFKDKIPVEILQKYNGIIHDDIVWIPINEISESQNWTYDFSLPDDVVEENDFHHSVMYNQILGYQTPSGLDPVFYKTFDTARKGKSTFKAVELWWFNDPRYNKDLVWLKNKGKTNEIRLIDENWDIKRRIQLMDDGWEASSPWFEEQIMNANGDMRKIAQELLCVFGDATIELFDKKEFDIITIKISELYDILFAEAQDKDSEVIFNYRYLIFNSSGDYVDFLGINKSYKDIGYKVTLENDMSITVSKDHIFLANGKNMYVTSLVPNITYITTTEGDFYVKSIEEVEGCDFYDIVDSEGCDYFANTFSNHNCSFLGSGDNFIAETYLKRIEEHEIKVPIRQEYTDLNMWIWEDPEAGEEYIQAIDASPGHGEDNSTINMLKIKQIIEEKVISKNGKTKKVKIKRFKVEQVAEYYGKLTPQQLAEVGYQFGKAYNNAYTVVDITGGYGVQTVEKLLEFGYPEEGMHYAEVTHKPSRDRLQGYIKKGQKTMSDGTVINVDLIPGFFIGNNRGSVLLEMQRAIHLEDVIIRSSRLLSELKTFVTVAGNRVADHKRTFHDDSIMGLAVGLYVVNYDMARFRVSKGVSEKILNAMITSNEVKEREMKDGVKNKPRISPSSTSPLNPYIAHSWLFHGIKPK